MFTLNILFLHNNFTSAPPIWVPLGGPGIKGFMWIVENLKVNCYLIKKNLFIY